MASVAFAVEGDGVGFATESYASSALYTTLAGLSAALWRIRRLGEPDRSRSERTTSRRKSRSPGFLGGLPVGSEKIPTAANRPLTTPDCTLELAQWRSPGPLIRLDITTLFLISS